MNQPSLGRLEPVDLRTVWPTEAQSFTPWLAQAENVALLAATIGLDLEVEAQEASVGPFRADILCKDTTSGHYVLIENQLERTDHPHLGQLLTYAAGLDAVTIVWVASRFTDEHRAALDWLNRITSETINFFGLEIELWRIGDSSVAPKFNLASKPNNWQKTVATATASGSGGGLTETQQLHLKFWTQFRQYMEDRKSTIRIGKPSKDHWTTIALGRTNFALVIWNGMRDDRSGVQVSLTGPLAKPHFYLLRDKYKSIIEGRLGSLEWRELPSAKESQIGIMRPGKPSDPAMWLELDQWFGEHITRWVDVFRPIVKELDASASPSTPQDGVPLVAQDLTPQSEPALQESA